MTEQNLFDAMVCDGVMIGSCVVLIEREIVYAGPIKTAPKMDGKTVLLNAADFDKSRTIVNRKRH